MGHYAVGAVNVKRWRLAVILRFACFISIDIGEFRILLANCGLASFIDRLPCAAHSKEKASFQGLIMLRLLRQLGSSIADAALGAMDQAQHADWLDKPSSAAPLPVAAAAQREKLRKTLAARSGLDLISEQLVDGWQLADDEFAVRAQAVIPAAMVVTSRRLLFGVARDGLILPLAKIAKIEMTRSLLESQLRLSLKSDRTETLPAGTDGAALRDVIERAAILARQELAALTELRENKKNDAPISEGDRRYRDLLKLTVLRDNDVLSADEYERERRQLLDAEPRR